jgi:hypothetical protein
MSKKILTCFFLLTSVFVFYWFSVSYSLNIPWLDDFENIPFFLSQWLDAPTWQARFTALLRPNNEHRVLTARLLVLANYWLTGSLNFKALALAGNLTVLGIFVIVARAYRQQSGQWLSLAAASFLIFNLQFYAMTFMTIMAMQYQLIIFEVFLALYLLLKPQNVSFLMALLVALLGTYSMGNGMMAWPTGALLLVMLAQWQRLGTWLLVGAIAIFFYFQGYNVAQNNTAAFDYFAQNAFKVFIGFFVFVGGILDWLPQISFQKRMLLPGLGGIFIIAFFVFYTVGVLTILPFWQKRIPSKVRQFYGQFAYFKSLQPQHGAFWIGCFVFLLINCFLVVFFRTRFDYQLILWATYKIYPGTLMAMSGLLLLQIIRPAWQPWFLTAFTIVALVSWASSYWHFVPEVVYQQKQRMSSALNQQRNGLGLGAYKRSTFADFLAGSLQDAQQKGFYVLPSPAIAPQEINIEKLLRDSTQTFKTIDLTNQKTIDELVLLQNDSLRFTEGQRTGVFMVLYSAQHFYVMATRPRHIEGKQATGFDALFPKGILYEGRYQTAIWLVQPNQNSLLKSAQTVVIE